MSDTHELRLLGPVEIELDGKRICSLKTQKATALLGYLVLSNQAVTRSFLAELLWPDKPEKRSRANLSRALYDISSVLPNCYRATHRTVQFQPNESLAVDIETYRERIQRATPASLKQALQLYRGELMTGITLDTCIEFEIWLATERERWRQSFSNILFSLIKHYSNRLEYDVALEFARQLEHLEPWREEVHRQIMWLLAQTGERSAALVQYEVCRETLAKELDIEPTVDTIQLYEQIRADTVQTSTAIDVQFEDAPSSVFVDRENERGWLLDEWDRFRRSNGRFVLIEGEAGVGKSRLIEEALHAANTSQTVILSSRCYELSIPLPYQPFIDALWSGLSTLNSDTELRDRFRTLLPTAWFVELVHFLPELHDVYSDLPDRRPGPGDAARYYLFEAIAQCFDALCKMYHSVILFIDDLHWSDSATLDLLTFLFSRLRGAPIWFVGAYRQEEVASVHPLLPVRHAQAQADRLALLELTPLPIEAVTEWAHWLVPGTHSEILAEFLYSRSDGNPWRITRYIQHLYDEGILSDAGLRVAKLANVDVPFTIREAILAHFNRLSPVSRTLLNVAAVIGYEFDMALLEKVTDTTAAIVESSLEEGFHRRFLSYRSADCYSFATDVFRDVIYANIPAPQKQRLHAAVATALERTNLSLSQEGADLFWR